MRYKLYGTRQSFQHRRRGWQFPIASSPGYMLERANDGRTFVFLVEIRGEMWLRSALNVAGFVAGQSQ